ncbi:MAG: hypothetical protein O8C64_12925 [Candidatus Methanoperedens sp.]|nr:hypothetical protein [Candidatus Methanoperedens sp.]MCZ7403779.1 hypothetical protein [Candidatus Methanoperedens sp.]
MTENELTSEQLENALDIEMKTFDLITKLVKKSFEEERIKRQPIKIVKTTPHESKKIELYLMAQKKSKA